MVLFEIDISLGYLEFYLIHFRFAVVVAKWGLTFSGHTNDKLGFSTICPM